MKCMNIAECWLYLLDTGSGADQKGQGSKRADVIKKSNGRRGNFLGRNIMCRQESEHCGFMGQEGKWPNRWSSEGPPWRNAAWAGHIETGELGKTVALKQWEGVKVRVLSRRVKFPLSYCRLNVSLYSSATAAVTSYHKLSGLQQHNYYRTILHTRGLTGLQARCEQDYIPCWDSRKEPLTLPFPTFRGCLHTLAPGPLVLSSKSVILYFLGHSSESHLLLTTSIKVVCF